MSLFKTYTVDECCEAYRGAAVALVKYTGFKRPTFGAVLRLPFKVGITVYNLPLHSFISGDWQQVLFIKLTFGKYGIPKVGIESEMVCENPTGRKRLEVLASELTPTKDLLPSKEVLDAEDISHLLVAPDEDTMLKDLEAMHEAMAECMNMGKLEVGTTR